MPESTPIKLFDVVALTTDLPEENLRRGQTGTVVEVLAADVFMVEFSDDNGRAYAIPTLPSKHLLVLHDRLS